MAADFLLYKLIGKFILIEEKIRSIKKRKETLASFIKLYNGRDRERGRERDIERGREGGGERECLTLKESYPIFQQYIISL